MREGQGIFEFKWRVTYYARVSTDEEGQISSITNQVEYFKKMIGGCDNWLFVPGYVDYGISGKNIRKRENFLKMIEDAVLGKFDLIVTKSVSRFARNTVDSIKYTDLLKSKGVYVFFVNDNINTFDGDSEFRLTLMASIAQDEIRKLSESVKFGLGQSIERGVVLGSSNILGYRKEKGKLVVVLDEALIVRDIFDLFVSGKYSYNEVARIINYKYSKKFSGSSIRRIIVNCKYKGFYCGRKSVVVDYKNGKRKVRDVSEWVVYRDYDSVPPIVLESTWDKAWELVVSRKRKIINFMYKDKVYCGIHRKVCSYLVKRYKNKKYGYFVCKDCLRVSDSLIKRICCNRSVLRIIIFKREWGFAFCVKYS